MGVVTGILKEVGKNILRDTFPGVYNLHTQYKAEKKKETPRSKPKTELGNQVEKLDEDIKETNILLTGQNDILAGQAVILTEILNSVNGLKMAVLMSGLGGSGPDFPDIEEEERKRRRRQQQQRKTPQAEEEETRNRKPQQPTEEESAKKPQQKTNKEAAKKAEIDAAKKAEKKVGRKTLERFVKFLERKGAKALAARIVAKLAGIAVGVTVPVLGWIVDVVLVAASIYDIYEAYQFWKEFQAEDKDEEESTKIDAKSLVFKTGDTAASDKEKSQTNNLKFNVADSITFKSNEMNIVAKEIVLSDNLINLLKNIKAQNDSADRERELTGPGGVGERFKGGPTAAAPNGEPIKGIPRPARVIAKKSPNTPSASVGEPYVSNFQGLVDDLEATGYKIRSMGGFANRANKSDPSKLSYHALGAALDINPDTNPFKTQKTDFPSNMASIAAAHGLGWGIRFSDPMHFSAAQKEYGSFNIPQLSMTQRYASGTPFVPKDGPAIVGELGSETIVSKDGTRKTAAGAHIEYLNRGDSVIPHGETRSDQEVKSEKRNAMMQHYAEGTNNFGIPGYTPTVPLSELAPQKTGKEAILEAAKGNKRLEAGLEKIGGASGINIDPDIAKLELNGVYVPKNTDFKKTPPDPLNRERTPELMEKTLGKYRGQIAVAPEGGAYNRNTKDVEMTGTHELGHVAGMAYKTNEGYKTGPQDLKDRIKRGGYLPEGGSDGGIFEESRQRAQDLETYSKMSESQRNFSQEYIEMYKTMGMSKDYTPDQIDEYTMNREKFLSDYNRDINNYYKDEKRSKGSSSSFLSILGNYL